MDAENFAVAYSVLILGFAIGISTAKLCSNYYFDAMKDNLENYQSKLYNKDRKIEELTEENIELRLKYNQLEEIKNYMTNMLYKTSIPPPNSPIQRRVCSEDDSNSEGSRD